MKILTTSQCTPHDHPEFRIIYDAPVPPQDVEWLADVLVGSVEQGSRFKDGETIELGTLFLRVTLEDGVLVVQEPDFCSMPITWVNGVTQSLRLQRLQKDIAESVQLGHLADYPSIRHGLTVGVDLDASTQHFLMDRLEGSENHSAWFVGRLDTVLDYNQPQSLTQMSVYEFLLGWPQVGGFLGLPTGTYLEIEPASLRIRYLGDLLEVVPNSFLDHKGWRE